MKRSATIAAILVVAIALGVGTAYAQSLSFQMEEEIVDVFLESDGTYRPLYAFRFTNNPGGATNDYH